MNLVDYRNKMAKASFGRARKRAFSLLLLALNHFCFNH